MQESGRPFQPSGKSRDSACTCSSAPCSCSSQSGWNAALHALDWALQTSDDLSDPWQLPSTRASVEQAARQSRQDGQERNWNEVVGFLEAVEELNSVGREVGTPTGILFDAHGPGGISAISLNDPWSKEKVEGLEPILNFILKLISSVFFFGRTCKCDLDYVEEETVVLGVTWKRCFILVSCRGTWPLCNFDAKIEVTCKPWWDDLPECPETEVEATAKVKETWDKGAPRVKVLFGQDSVPRRPTDDGYGWCREGPSKYHPGADNCYRTVRRVKGGMGQQCCYKDGKLVTDGEAAGTPDKVAVASAVKSDGACENDISVKHYWEDVRPFDNKQSLEAYLKHWSPSGSEYQKQWRDPYRAGLRLKSPGAKVRAFKFVRR